MTGNVVTAVAVLMTGAVLAAPVPTPRGRTNLRTKAMICAVEKLDSVSECDAAADLRRSYVPLQELASR